MSENDIHADDSLTSTPVQENTPETAEEREHRLRKAKRRRRLFTILPPILLVLGILVLLYPVISTYNNSASRRHSAPNRPMLAEMSSKMNWHAPTNTTVKPPKLRSLTPGWNPSGPIPPNIPITSHN